MTPDAGPHGRRSRAQLQKADQVVCHPQLFRYERQQKGRLREHFQFNADIIGEADQFGRCGTARPAHRHAARLRLTAEDFVIRLSSRNAWQDFFPETLRRCRQATSSTKSSTNWNAKSPEESQKKLAALGFSLDEVSDFIAAGKPTAELETILENSAGARLGGLCPRSITTSFAAWLITRGVVFEAFDSKGEFRAIAGGGRYDNLVKLISGGKVNLPALGFGMGDVVLLELLKSRGLLPKFDSHIEAFCLIEDEALRGASLELVQHLREHGYAVDYSFTPAKSDKQFKRAMELKARYTVKVETTPEGEPAVRVKNLATREEKLVSPPTDAHAALA